MQIKWRLYPQKKFIIKYNKFPLETEEINLSS